MRVTQMERKSTAEGCICSYNFHSAEALANMGNKAKKIKKKKTLKR